AGHNQPQSPPPPFTPWGTPHIGGAPGSSWSHEGKPSGFADPDPNRNYANLHYYEGYKDGKAIRTGNKDLDVDRYDKIPLIRDALYRYGLEDGYYSINGATYDPPGEKIHYARPRYEPGRKVALISHSTADEDTYSWVEARDTHTIRSWKDVIEALESYPNNSIS